MMRSSQDSHFKWYWRLRLVAGTIALTIAFALVGCDTAPSPSAPRNSNLPKDPSSPAAGNNQRRRANPAQAPPGPAGWSLLDNRRVRLADHAGKVVVLDFWATYCPPCIAEAPHLVALQRKYGKDGLVVVGLNVGGPEDRPKIPDFIQQTGVQYDLGIPDNVLVDSLMGTDDTIPQTFIFDRQGKLVKNFTGFTPEMGNEIEQAIQAALGAKP